MYGLVCTSAPAIEPVTLAEARAWLRFDSDDTSQDTVISALIAAARQWVELQTERQLITATWRLTLESFCPESPLGDGRGTIRLPRPPLQAISAIAYVDDNGDSQEVDEDSYEVGADSEPGQVQPAYGLSWPTVRAGLSAVQITYTAGYGSAVSSVPEALKTAIKMLAAHWFEHPEAAGPGAAANEQPLGVRAILANYWTGAYA